MGIDCYARWRNQTKEEKESQYTGYSVKAGNVGYLREAYHGGPYVTKFLLREAFDPEEFGMIEYVQREGATDVIPFKELTEEERDEYKYETMGVHIPASTLRERLPLAVLLSIYRERVVYHEKTDPSNVGIDGLMGALADVFIVQVSDKSHEQIAKQFTKEHLAAVAVLIHDKLLPDYAQSFVDFVELCEKTEKETGEHCYIHASY